jgi:putative sugar O-methyltransferase
MVLRPPTVTRLRALNSWDRFQNDAAELAESVARRVVLPRIDAERLGASVQRLKPARRHLMMPMLEGFAALRPQASFVQIGSHDGQQQDPLRDIVLSREWSGIMVEPVPYVFARLQHHYGHLQRVQLENLAVGPIDGTKPFYHLRDTSGAGRPGLPIWFDALGSFDRDVVLGHRQYIPDIESRIVELEVPCVTFTTLCERNGVERVDFLHTDTEGYDFEILRSVDFDRVRPTLIVYEHVHLPPEDRQACRELLAGFDYETFEYGLDTWCFNASTLPVPDAEALVPLWRWLTDPARPAGQLAATRALRLGARRIFRRPAGSDAMFGGLFELTDSERRYLNNGYDDSTPLPRDAAAYLRPDNSRLRALTRDYAALKVPAVEQHMWTSDRVASHVDLRYFRGDNLYVWHRPEHPRSMAMAQFIYMRYLERRGGAELLARIPEDGAFGCWTSEVTGRGALSRDRLDSASEILFLERQLNVLSRHGIRILDIGAGYGRLAYRMAQAHPSLGDYCCVDAVPESTFLCEYYLGFRNVSPPTRVVPLVDVPELEPGSFDLAVNIHSFSECTRAAVEWWLAQLTRLRVPHLFVIPNEAEGIISREPDGGYHDLMPSIAAAGYKLTAVEPVITDPAVRELVQIHDSFHLFEFEPSAASARLT